MAFRATLKQTSDVATSATPYVQDAQAVFQGQLAKYPFRQSLVLLAVHGNERPSAPESSRVSATSIKSMNLAHIYTVGIDDCKVTLFRVNVQ